MVGFHKIGDSRLDARVWILDPGTAGLAVEIRREMIIKATLPLSTSPSKLRPAFLSASFALTFSGCALITRQRVSSKFHR